MSPLLFLVQKCVYPEEYEGHFESLMISKDEIMQAVRSLANQINEDYKDCRPVMVCVLKGANPVRLLTFFLMFRCGFVPIRFLTVDSVSLWK